MLAKKLDKIAAVAVDHGILLISYTLFVHREMPNHHLYTFPSLFAPQQWHPQKMYIFAPMLFATQQANHNPESQMGFEIFLMSRVHIESI